MNIRNWFLARRFSRKDVTGFFLRQIVVLLCFAHADYWAAEETYRYMVVNFPRPWSDATLALFMLGSLFLVTVGFLGAFAFVCYMAYSHLTKIEFASNIAARCALGIGGMFFGELLTWNSAQVGSSIGVWYCSILTLAGFCFFFRWFSEGPHNPYGRLLTRSE